MYPSQREHRDRHSFPTRRSSDLIGARTPAGGGAGRLFGRFSAAVSFKRKGVRRDENRTGQPGDSRAYLSADLRNTARGTDRKSTRLNSSHSQISYAVFCLKKKKK